MKAVFAIVVERLIVAVLAIASGACLVTATEVVGDEDAVRLCGSRLLHDDRMGQKQTVYAWNEPRRGYLDPEQGVLIRFGRLTGDTYVAQAQILRGGDVLGSTPSLDRDAYLVTVVKLAPPRLLVETADCRERGAALEWLARGYGTEIDASRDRVTGTRSGVLGMLVATLGCDRRPLDDLVLVPDSIAPGGPELAVAATAYDRGRFVPFLVQKCDNGDAEGCYKLGRIYRNGEGVARDPARAAQYFEKTCEARDMRGCLDLGLILERGEGVAGDHARAFQLIRQACDGDEMYACDLLKALKPPPTADGSDGRRSPR